MTADEAQAIVDALGIYKSSAVDNVHEQNYDNLAKRMMAEMATGAKSDDDIMAELKAMRESGKIDSKTYYEVMDRLYG